LYLCKNFFNSNIKYKMKRLFALLVMAGLCFVACGPSAEEIAKEKQRVDDSIARVEAEAEAAKLAAEAEEAKLAAEAAEAAKLEAEAEAANAKKTTTVKKTTTATAEPAKTEPAKPAEEQPKGKSKLSGLKQTN
jgi:hypothetical protein